MKKFLKHLQYKLLGYYRLKTKKRLGFLGQGDVTESQGVAFEQLQPSGQWDNYLPRYEYQRFAFGETFACVTYSFFNCLETLIRRVYNEQWDFSDRFTAKKSGTTNQGNSMYKVFQSVAVTDGFVSFPFWSNEGTSFDDFYKAIPDTVTQLGKENQKYFTFSMEWLPTTSTENIKKALKESPLWVAIYAYGPKVNGVYQRIVGNMPNHCVEMYGYDEQGNWKIYDHYLGSEYRLLASDYIIGYAAKLKVTKS